MVAVIVVIISWAEIFREYSYIPHTMFNIIRFFGLEENAILV
jgi:hypothetical protein